jgi:hypothetical protein
MYPAFNTTRPRLPSLLSVYGPIEQYNLELGRRSPFCGNAAALGPLDAYLVHLLMTAHSGEPAILDLAAEETAGASTLLSLLHPRQPHVRAVSGPLPGDRRAYRAVVEDFLQRQVKDLSSLQWLPHAEPTADLLAETDAFIFVSGNTPTVAADVERWLNLLPSAIVLVFGLGPVGDCAALDALLQRFPTGSSRRLMLLRESGEALSASKLGMVAERDNAAAEAALQRLKQWFTSNYSFLGLLRSASERAIRSSGSDTAVRESDGSFLEWNHEINQLKKAAQHARENAEAVEELRAIKGRLSYRLCERFCSWRGQLARYWTWRHRLLQRLRRVAQIIRSEGVRSLPRRIVRRCLRRKSNASV